MGQKGHYLVITKEMEFKQGQCTEHRSFLTIKDTKHRKREKNY